MNEHHIDHYDFELPEALIAQVPTTKRDQSRLLKYNCSKDLIQHGVFSDIKQYLNEGDLLVMNNTKVIPARIKAKRPTGGAVEIFLVREQSENIWRCLAKSSRKLGVGSEIILADDCRAKVIEILDGGYRLIQFEMPQTSNARSITDWGDIPLPPYIQRETTAEDLARYQTVFASQEGAVAAPTAGLHFTPELLNDIKLSGVELAELTLHVGPGTFKPVSVDDIREHQVDPEYFDISEETVAQIIKAKKEGRRVISVGTTTTRVLEYLGSNMVAQTGWTDLYLYPPAQFQVVDAMITNFHLPKSSLLLLVSCLVGRENLLNIYSEAIKECYRFYSYGDAMFIE